MLTLRNYKNWQNANDCENDKERFQRIRKLRLNKTTADITNDQRLSVWCL